MFYLQLVLANLFFCVCDWKWKKTQRLSASKKSQADLRHRNTQFMTCHTEKQLSQFSHWSSHCCYPGRCYQAA